MKRQTKKLNSKKIIQVVTMLILCLILVFACIFGYSVYKDTAAFDSKKYEKVLFVAHREEILKQAAVSFQNVRNSKDYGFFMGAEKCTDKPLINAPVASLGKPE